jgi:hypothetical protein
MQYVDDILLFLKNDLASAMNLKWILSYFEEMFGMMINFHKCDPISINVEENDAQLFAQYLSCRLGHFPLKYLGLPLHYNKLNKEDMQPIIEKILKKVPVGGVDC